MEPAPDEARVPRRYARDLAALLALPGMWHGREPAYILASLLDVLLSLLRLDSVYARFDDADGGLPLDGWRPPTASPPEELVHSSASPLPDEPPVTVTVPDPEGGTIVRVTRLSPAFLHERGVVVVASRRIDFPTEIEQSLLRVAIDQAAISLHGAHLLAREQAAHRRLAFLAEASTQLAASLDYERTLQKVADLAVPTLADGCSVDIVLADERLHRIAVAHKDAAMRALLLELRRRYPAQRL